MATATVEAAVSMDTDPNINEINVLNPAKKVAAVGGDGQAITPLTPVRKSAPASFGTPNGAKSKPRAGKAQAKRKNSAEFVDDGLSFSNNFWDMWEKVALKVSHSEAVFKTHLEANPNDPVAIMLNEQHQSSVEIINLMGNCMQNMSGKLDILTKRTDGINNTLETNKKVKNIATNPESSELYSNTKIRVKQSAFETKVLGVDIGKECTNKDEIIQRAKEVLNSDAEIQNLIEKDKVVVTAIGSKTKVYNGKHTCPILLKSKQIDKKATLDKTLRKSYIVAHQWPKNIMDEIADLRKKYQAVKNPAKQPTLDLTDKYILIRPNHETGATLQVYYRAKDSKEFKYLESIKTPADKDLLKQFNVPQISKSNFF